MGFKRIYYIFVCLTLFPGDKTMKVLIIGGAGNMGTSMAKDLLEHYGGTEITLGDYREDVAKKIAESLGANVKTAKIDANNQNELVGEMKKHDISLNACGPNYRFAVKVVKAAIESGTNLVDICDDYEPAMEILKLDGEAKKKGASILTGMGWTPGLSNVLAKKGSELMETVDTINISWTGDPNSEGIAVTEHMLYIITGKIPSYINGELKYVPAGKGKVKLKFPEPVGEQTVYDVGHPEPVTIPHFIKGVKNVTLKGALVPQWTNTYLKLFYVFPGRTKTIEQRRKLAESIQQFAHKKFIKNRLKDYIYSTLRVEISGTKNNQPLKKTYLTIDTMDRLTGIPASIGTKMLSEKSEPGVYAPEGIIDTKKFFEELSKRNIKIIEE